MADLASIIQDMREYGTAGPDSYLGPHHMALCLKQQANIWADQLAALSHAAGHEVVANVPRVETGVVQFGDDWPGVFIRGDNAAAFAMYLRTGDSAWWSAAVESLAKLLESCNVANNPNARIIPLYPAVARSEGEES